MMRNIPSKQTSIGDISAQWSKIPYTNISLRFFILFYFIFAHALIINKLNSNGKDIRNEQTLLNR